MTYTAGSRAGRKAYRIAVLCGAIPLSLGLVTFGVWVVTRWRPLMLVGGGILLAGLGIFVGGCVALAMFSRRAKGTADAPPPAVARKTFLCGALLFSNFPAAAAIIVAFILIGTRYSVTVMNRSGATLDDVKIYGGGFDVSLGSLAPGAKAKASCWIEDDDELRIEVLRGGMSRSEVIDEYVTNGVGGLTTVTVHGDGSLTVDFVDGI